MAQKNERVQKFSKMGAFSVISSLRVKTPQEAFFDIEDSVRLGADGFLLHAELLEERYRNIETISKIIASAEKPFMILDYLTDEESEICASFLLDSVRAGAAAVDIPMHLYDNASMKSLENRAESFASALPSGVSMDQNAIERQKQLIAKIHEEGGEVLISAHVGKMLSCVQAEDLAKEMRARGADIAKIIVKAESADDVAEIYKTCCVLKTKLGIPFLYQTCGVYGKLVRPTAWMFGSRYVLCHNRYSEISNREKPLIEDVQRIKNELACGVSEHA